jgi:hypothetical protein
LTQNPEEANYLLQANVLQVGKVDLSAARKGFASGYGGGLEGFAMGAIATNTLGGSNGLSVGVGILGGILGTVANAMVKDVTYSIITDIQISERVKKGVVVNESNRANLVQGTSGSKTITSNEKTQWKRYQTRIMSTANKVNLDFIEASPLLVQGLVRSISGIM